MHTSHQRAYENTDLDSGDLRFWFLTADVNAAGRRTLLEEGGARERCHAEHVLGD